VKPLRTVTKDLVLLVAATCCLAGCGSARDGEHGKATPGTELPPTPSWAKVSKAQMAEAEKRGVPVAFANKAGIKFVLVPAGEFLMGSAEDEPGRYPGEGPQHKVTIRKPFYVAIHQVTQGQWKSAVGTKPWLVERAHSVRDDPANVATWVDWDDATNFCAKLSKQESRPYRLLSEAEWEYMCRAGSTTRYFYGDDLKLENLNEYGWYGQEGWSGLAKGDRYVRPPGLKKPNAWGIYDTIGSVWEMCQDVTHPNYKGAPTDGSAWITGAPTDKEPDHPLRGGGSHSSDRRVRSASRHAYHQSSSSHYVGFRVCCDLPPRAK
jgi:formylglycine-generating enzyme required for sulfatase activity